MTPSQLRQWSFQNSQPDQWWISLDAVTEEIPVTVAEIEERMKSGDYSAVQALHVSQAGMENAPWVEVAMPPPMKAPPLIQPSLAVAAPSPVPALQGNKPSKKDYGDSGRWFLLMLGITLLIVGLKENSMFMTGGGIGFSLSAVRKIFNNRKSI